MKALKIGAAVVAVVVLAGLAYAALLVRSLDTPEFRKSVLERARTTLGTEVEVQEMKVSLLSGVTLRGVTVANPPGFPGKLLAADAFVLRYRLLPLLRGQLQIEKLSLEKPVLTLAVNARGAWNYERIGGGAAASGKGATLRRKGAAPAERTARDPPGLPVELVLSRISLDDAEIVMLGERNASLVRVQQADLSSSLKLAGTSAAGKGKATIETLNLADALSVRNLTAPIEIVGDKVQFDPIRAELAGGKVSGILSLRLKGGLHYAVNLELKGADVRKLLEEAGSARAVTGKLGGEAWFEGSGGLPTLSGKGRAEIKDCKVAEEPLMAVLAQLLRMPELRTPDFDECRAEFTLASSRLHVTVLKLDGPDLRLTGRGVTSLTDYRMSYDMTLALRKEALDRIPVREIKAAFQEREGGFAAIDFKVTGTTTAPQTDLTARLGKAAATELVKGGLGKLFGRRK